MISPLVVPPILRPRPPRVAVGAVLASGLENAVLDEVAGGLGPLLWRSVRSVLFWAQTSPADRHELFPEGAYERRLADLLEMQPPAPLVEPCEGLAELLLRPGTAEPAQVAGHSVAIANWARQERKSGTAMVFLHAAATCCPFNPGLSLLAGREARDQARHRLAEAWLDNAVTVSRRAGSWELYARAHIAYANMMKERGALPAAKRHALKARRRAERHGLTAVLAMAHHDLFVIAAECGDLGEAHDSVRQAMKTYGAGHPGLVNLAFDLALVWMREGYFEAALSVYRTLLPSVQERFLPHIHGTIARAAGACGLASEYRQSVRALQALPIGTGSAEAWLDVSHGAVSLGCWSEAAEHLARCLAISRDRRERKIEFLAESLLPRLSERNQVPLATPGFCESGASELAADLVDLLPRTPAGSAA